MVGKYNNYAGNSNHWLGLSSLFSQSCSISLIEMLYLVILLYFSPLFCFSLSPPYHFISLYAANFLRSIILALFFYIYLSLFDSFPLSPPFSFFLYFFYSKTSIPNRVEDPGRVETDPDPKKTRIRPSSMTKYGFDP